MEPAPVRQRLSNAIEVALIILVGSFAFFFSEFHQSLNRVHPPATLERLCAYTAETPYQNRILVPTIVRAIDTSGAAAKVGLTQLDIARWIEAACVLALFYALRALLAQFFRDRWSPTLWSLVGLYALPFL